MLFFMQIDPKVAVPPKRNKVLAGRGRQREGDRDREKGEEREREREEGRPQDKKAEREQLLFL